MNLHWIDWSIVVALLAFLIFMAVGTKRYMRSVADFLAAGRCAGRYLICVSDGIAGLGAITLLAFWEMYSQGGFTALWWDLPNYPIVLLLALTGWIVYRFRRTRAMTLAQFFETRYSRSFRIFAGILAFTAGTINFGIFPAVGARFFIYFCDLPPSFFPLVMFILLAIALFFTFSGGQIAVIITDFVQGTFSMIVLSIACIYLLVHLGWPFIREALATAPENASYINPFRISEVEGFDTPFFLIQYFVWAYCWRAWQGNQGYSCAATTPHEQRMAFILGQWRYFAQQMIVPILAVAAIAFLNHPHPAPGVADAEHVLATIANDKIQTQMTVPVALSKMLPVGLMGGLAAVMLAAFISTHDTYLHSWGSIFVQDVLIPIRGRPLTPKQHILALRLAILGVAVFIFCFGLLFRQTEFIRMFFAITGAIYLAGAGACIVGGLYTRWGTTGGAWTAMTLGALIAVAGMIARQINPDFPLDGQRVMFVAGISAIAAYIIVSLLSPKGPFNLDRMLHRGAYAIESDTVRSAAPAPRHWRWLGITDEFSRRDRFLYFASIAWVALWLGVFVVGILLHLHTEITDDAWMRFWHFMVWMAVTLAVFTTLWFTIGGIRDMKEMYRRLRIAVRDETDDGYVVQPQAPGLPPVIANTTPPHDTRTPEDIGEPSP
jgi:SSS family solute:Na+ symporter